MLNSLKDTPLYSYARTLEDWLALNSNNLAWWKSTYPNVKNYNVDFPIPVEFLKNYYVERMNYLKQTPNQEFLNTYDYLLSFFLYFYDKGTPPPGKSWLDYTRENFPNALKQGIGDAAIDFSKLLLPFVVLYGVYVISNLTKE